MAYAPGSNGPEPPGPHDLSYTSLDLGIFRQKLMVACGQTRGGFIVIALLDPDHRRTSLRCGVHYEVVEAKTTDQHNTCNSIRHHRVLAGLTYCQNILDLSTVLVIRRRKTNGLAVGRNGQCRPQIWRCQ